MQSESGVGHKKLQIRSEVVRRPSSHDRRMKPLRFLLPTNRFNPHDRAVALVMWSVGVIQGFAQAQPSTTLPFTRDGLGLTPSDMSALLAVARLMSLGAIAIAMMGDRHGRRRPLLASYVLLVMATGATAVFTNPLGFTLTQGLVRVGTSAISSLGVVWLAEQLSPAVRAYGVSLYGAAGSLGAGAAILGLPLAELDWRSTYVLTLLGLALLPWLARRVVESPLIAGSPAVTPGPRATVAAVAAEGGAVRFWVAGAAGLLASAFSAVGLAFSTERLVTDLGLATGTAVAVTLIGGTIGGLGFFIGGRMSDAWGRKPTTVVSLLMILTGGVALYRVEELGLLVAAIVVSSFGSFAYIPSAATHRAEMFPTRARASVTSSLGWLGTLGSSAGLVIGRFTIDGMGLSNTMNLLGIGIVIAAGLTLLLPETKGRVLTA